MTRLRQRMLDDLRRRNYSPVDPRLHPGGPTVCRVFRPLSATLGRRRAATLSDLSAARTEAGTGTLENCISALRFLYKKTLKRRDLAFDDLPFPKQPRTLPTVLSQDEVTRLIDAAPNRMHRMLLMVLYATGMRRTEASMLKVTDIDSPRMVIHIRRGKGLRDRDVPLTPKLLEALASTSDDSMEQARVVRTNTQ